MKKLISIALVLILSFSITACRKNNMTHMELVKAELSEQEAAIIELLKFNDSAGIFEFEVDDTVKTISVNSYELDENGNWKSIGGGRHALDSKRGRLAFKFNIIAKGMTFSIQDESRTTGINQKIPETTDISSMSTATAFANNPTEIEYEKEVPIAVQIVTSKENIISFGVEYFAEPQKYKNLGYEHVYAVAVTFSQKDFS